MSEEAKTKGNEEAKVRMQILRKEKTEKEQVI